MQNDVVLWPSCVCKSFRNTTGTLGLHEFGANANVIDKAHIGVKNSHFNEGHALYFTLCHTSKRKSP